MNRLTLKSLKSFAAIRMTTVQVWVSKRRRGEKNERLGFAEHYEASALLLGARAGMNGTRSGRRGRALDAPLLVLER